MTEQQKPQKENIYDDHTYSYLALRRAVGLLGVTLPLILILVNQVAKPYNYLDFERQQKHVKDSAHLYHPQFGDSLRLGQKYAPNVMCYQDHTVQNSISHYFHTPARSTFVGVLCAVAIFMFFYTGYDYWDNYLGNAVAIAALGVAFFPTCTGLDICPVKGTYCTIHLISGGSFFLFLGIFAFARFTRTDPNKSVTPEKVRRNKFYKACGLIIWACLLLMILYTNPKLGLETYFPRYTIFTLEWVALFFFGASWLVKGNALRKYLTFLYDPK